MSTSPDELVNVLSHWLARHVDDDELRRELLGVDPDGLSAAQREALDELRQELDSGDSGGDLEMVIRETLESLALG
jgi:hypothetical protein